MKPIALFAFCLVINGAVAEEFKGTIDFTSDEVSAYRTHSEAIVTSARSELERVWNDHQAFHAKHGFSKYYGDRSSALDSPEKRKSQIRRLGKDEQLATELIPTSCIGLTLNSLEIGFLDTKVPALESAWKKIREFTNKNGVSGMALIHTLQKLGWKVYYWNPAPEKSDSWDTQERNWASKGYHSYRLANVRSQKRYWTNRVDDAALLVGFGADIPSAFTEIPFFVGVAHTGYHVFPGFEGTIIEAHSTRALSSIDNLEMSKFNPLGLGGGPRWTSTEKYRSGLIAAPPSN